MSADTQPDPADARVTVLIDDTRAFRDGRPCRTARSSADGVALLLELRGQHIAHLWLDHDLGGDDDIWPVARLLEDASLQGPPFDIGLVHIQASRSGPAHRIGLSMRRTGHTTERPTDPRLWTRWDGRPASAVATAATAEVMLDADELWAVHTALAATCQMIASSEADVLLLMDLQDEAHALLTDVGAHHHEPLSKQAPLGGACCSSSS